MKKYPPEQGKVFKGFLKWFEGERKILIQDKDIERPDEKSRNREEIDYLVQRCKFAIEVSSAWRSEAAGKEDRDWAEVTEEVEAQLRGRAPGRCHVFTELRLPVGVTAEAFSSGLLVSLRGREAELKRIGAMGKGLEIEVCGVKCFVSMFGNGNDVSFGRRIRNEDLNEYKAFIRRIIRKKSPRLRRYKVEEKDETWLVLYNTMWPVFSPHQIKELILAELTNEHEHIDHIAIVAGNPPEDCWVDVVRESRISGAF